MPVGRRWARPGPADSASPGPERPSLVAGAASAPAGARPRDGAARRGTPTNNGAASSIAARCRGPRRASTSGMPQPSRRFDRIVRIVVATCQIDYAGRLTAHLPLATRVLMVKADGSVLVHSDGGSYKPLNWMSPPCTVREGDHDGRPGRVDRHVPRPTTPCASSWRRPPDSTTSSASTPACRRTASRSTSRSSSPSTRATLADGLTLVRREYPTAIGPVDLMCRDAAGSSVAVEIKRRGDIDGVEQLTRYLELLNRDPLLTARAARHLRRPGDPSRRPGCWPPTAASPARSSTTTPCAGSTTRPTGCSRRCPCASSTSPPPRTGRRRRPPAATRPPRAGARWPRRASSTPAAATSGRGARALLRRRHRAARAARRSTPTCSTPPWSRRPAPGSGETFPHIFGPIAPEPSSPWCRWTTPHPARAPGSSVLQPAVPRRGLRQPCSPASSSWRASSPTLVGRATGGEWGPIIGAAAVWSWACSSPVSSVGRELDDLLGTAPRQGDARAAVAVAVDDPVLPLEPHRRAARPKTDLVPQHRRTGQPPAPATRPAAGSRPPSRLRGCDSTPPPAPCRRPRCRASAARRTSDRRVEPPPLEPTCSTSTTCPATGTAEASSPQQPGADARGVDHEVPAGRQRGEVEPGESAAERLDASEQPARGRAASRPRG